MGLFRRCVLLAVLAVHASTLVRAHPAVPVVFTADVNSIIHPVSAEYMVETMDLSLIHI